VTRVNVDTATLLSDWPVNEIRAIVRVDVRPTELTYANMSLL
jgi:hypothetical protein